MAPKPSATVRYTAMRLGIFAGCFFVLWGLVFLGVLPRGLGDSNLLWVLVLAIVVSAPLSFVLLRGQREEMSEQIVGKVDRAKSRLAENRSMEDGVREL
ncbi:DUF4229 domain-containing protein [Streptomyces sp. B-S-A8]|uniref:DUF4229 domain-containing protein n=1 Tax=Streptomyces solicavernae TaxID=3043614 RepID=A0ABT6RQ36_9ACTN|nr:DUF4229 domain-containing protein [Streptomyces sp. B-S-A8]MDI3385868.1 DUF4229 domain-containing protein [Streptomyces sp. B-S-A8]